MLPTHQLVQTHLGYKIYQRQPGFEFTPILLGKIASYLVIHPEHDTLAVYAFMYSLLDSLAGQDSVERSLLHTAVRVIEERIDAGTVMHRTDTTFEYRSATFVEVPCPAWWVPSFRPAAGSDQSG